MGSRSLSSISAWVGYFIAKSGVSHSRLRQYFVQHAIPQSESHPVAAISSALAHHTSSCIPLGYLYLPSLRDVWRISYIGPYRLVFSHAHI